MFVMDVPDQTDEKLQPSKRNEFVRFLDFIVVFEGYRVPIVLFDP